MKLLNRLKFALRYNIDSDFIVYDFKSQQAVRFVEYTDALKFASAQWQYKPRIMVGVRKK